MAPKVKDNPLEQVLRPDSGRGNGGNGQDTYWHDGWGGEVSPPIPNAKLAMMLLVVASSMLFVGLTGAYIVLRFLGGAWPPDGLPPLPRSLWFNTAAILASSASLFLAQLAIRSDHLRGAKWGLLITTILGALFLAGQIRVWYQLGAAGLHMSSGRYGSSFYTLTLVHGLHVTGGILFLLYVTAQAWRRKYSRENYVTVDVCGIYWHFVDALWLFLFSILYLV